MALRMARVVSGNCISLAVVPSGHLPPPLPAVVPDGVFSENTATRVIRTSRVVFRQFFRKHCFPKTAPDVRCCLSAGPVRFNLMRASKPESNHWPSAGFILHLRNCVSGCQPGLTLFSENSPFSEAMRFQKTACFWKTVRSSRIQWPAFVPESQHVPADRWSASCSDQPSLRP